MERMDRIIALEFMIQNAVYRIGYDKFMVFVTFLDLQSKSRGNVFGLFFLKSSTCI